MMRHGLKHGLLAALVGLGVWVGLVRGDGPVPPAVPPHGHGYEPVVVPVPPAGVDVVAPRRPLRDWCRTWAREHPWFCWSHHNYIGCGSLKAEWTYIFGSCREWYGEPCLKAPPPVPLPPGYDPALFTLTRGGCSTCP